MRVYISGGITGIDKFKDNFAKAEKDLTADGYIPVNPTKLDYILFHDANYEEYMKIDIMLLDMCDAIYMLQGWEKSCGANREYGYALAKDKTIMFEK